MHNQYAFIFDALPIFDVFLLLFHSIEHFSQVNVYSTMQHIRTLRLFHACAYNERACITSTIAVLLGMQQRATYPSPPPLLASFYSTALFLSTRHARSEHVVQASIHSVYVFVFYGRGRHMDECPISAANGTRILSHAPLHRTPTTVKLLCFVKKHKPTESQPKMNGTKQKLSEWLWTLPKHGTQLTRLISKLHDNISWATLPEVWRCFEIEAFHWLGSVSIYISMRLHLSFALCPSKIWWLFGCVYFWSWTLKTNVLNKISHSKTDVVVEKSFLASTHSTKQ